MKRTISFFFLALIICSFVFSGCSLFENDGSGHVFKVSLPSNPSNLDPQIASDSSSIAVAKNLYLGLLRLENGRIENGVAKNYVVSDDGLIYTFYLDDRYSWKSLGDFEALLTAHDFVFAFQRLLDQKTASPYFEKYFCIKNGASAYYKDVSVSEIGVKALNDYTLEFELEYPNADFLYLLCELSSSPCNREFFNLCAGKYGLDAQTVASNGPFYVRYWLYDKYNKSNYIKLTRNSSYSQINRVYPSGVTYLINSDDVKLNNFTEEQTDLIVTKDAYKALIDAEYAYKSYETSTYGFIFNSKIKAFKDKEVRSLFSMSIDRDNLKFVINDGFSPANTVFPDNTYISGNLLESKISEETLKFDKMNAEYRWSFVLSDSEKAKINGINILVCDEFNNVEILRSITDYWYEILGIHIGIEIVNPSDYKNRVLQGQYDILLLKLEAQEGDAFEFIKPFSTDGLLAEPVEEAVRIGELSGKYKTLTAKINDFIFAEKKIVEDYLFIPICHGKTFCFYQEDVADFEYDVYQDSILFEKAKCY